MVDLIYASSTNEIWAMSVANNLPGGRSHAAKPHGIIHELATIAQEQLAPNPIAGINSISEILGPVLGDGLGLSSVAPSNIEPTGWSSSIASWQPAPVISVKRLV